ncbi:hypothetical protein PHMEG_00012058 [Phytophthora megakarya]|uniref:Uncharacterized protein n=1 Tax=Phytophthora megakarya TaxID=4795 RepID=A0A225W9N9_9STRA|nr:hypothetical protein PHMEG_00012058 [Phytophthora megakarya]
MFVFSLQKRHKDNSRLCELAVKLLECFSHEMPISLPIVMGDRRRQSPLRPLFSPTTTISNLYREAPSPYSPITKLPITRPPTSPVEQSRRAKIFSMPKLAAIEGRQYRCNTPNALPSRFERSNDVDDSQMPDLLFTSLPQSPSGSSLTKPRVVSQKYSWDPECINSVSGFEWWWRSLPPNHTSLEPTQQLKMVTKAAVRLHSKGELQHAIELYLLALSWETNDEVKFRLRINLACAYEAAENVQSSIDQFRLALRLSPNDPYAIYKLGSALTLVGAFEEARMHFESIHEYPQATDGLKNLEKATEVQKQREEARKGAIAAAKQSRSPLKSVSPRIYVRTPRESCAPSTPVVETLASRRKKTPTAKRDPIRTSELNHTADIQGHLETTTVVTSTDENLLSPSLLKTIVSGCQEGRIDILEVMKMLDPQQRGFIHKDSFVGLLWIIAGANMAQVDDDATQVALNISPNDWISHEGKTFLKYRGFLEAYTNQNQAESPCLPSDELLQAKLIDDLIQQDMANISNHNVAKWVRLGSERAVAELYKVAPVYLETITRKQFQLRYDTRGTKSSPKFTEFTPRTRARKDRAREEWLLTAEKAQILARRQQHCIKSLRDIAARARAHINCRRNAITFLLVVAQNAREQLRTRKLRCLAASQSEPATETQTHCSDEIQGGTQTDHDVESSQLEPECNETSDQLKSISEKIYDASVRTAMTRLFQHTKLDAVKTVAGRFAACCEVPSFFTDV